MAFDIIFYNSLAERNRLDKTNYLRNAITLNGVLRDSCDITSPSILIELNGLSKKKLELSFPTAESIVNITSVASNDIRLIDYNYCHIPSFNRYYFVTNIVSVKTNLWQVELECDVLMSYKDDILKQEVLFERSESNSSPYIVDSLVPYKQGYNIETIDVPNELFGNYMGQGVNQCNIIIEGVCAQGITLSNKHPLVINLNHCHIVGSIPKFVIPGYDVWFYIEADKDYDVPAEIDTDDIPADVYYLPELVDQQTGGRYAAVHIQNPTGTVELTIAGV